MCLPLESLVEKFQILPSMWRLWLCRKVTPWQSIHSASEHTCFATSCILGVLPILCHFIQFARSQVTGLGGEPKCHGCHSKILGLAKCHKLKVPKMGNISIFRPLRGENLSCVTEFSPTGEKYIPPERSQVTPSGELNEMGQ